MLEFDELAALRGYHREVTAWIRSHVDQAYMDRLHESNAVSGHPLADALDYILEFKS